MKASLLLWVYLLLVVLLGCTIGMALMPLGSAFKPLAGVLVAVIKAGLIAMFFMQLRYHRGTVRLFAAAGIFFLFLLFFLIACDYLTRQWV